MARPLPRRIYLAIGEILTAPWFHPIHRRLYRWTGGRGAVGRALGMEVILVTARGRRTGQPRTVPLAAVRDRERWLVVGSNAGKDRTPGWAHNLRADGQIEVEHRRRAAPFRAREAGPDEAPQLWLVVVAAYAGYAVYRDRTDRTIPLFVLEPVRAG